MTRFAPGPGLTDAGQRSSHNNPITCGGLPDAVGHPLATGRRAVLGAFLAAAAALPSRTLERATTPHLLLNLPAEWEAFRARYMQADGRIVDTAAFGVSHTEGQGIGMLIAAVTGDLASFEAIRNWTRRNLRRMDGLHAWRWLPLGAERVPDANNATDGDILIAWALQRAARLFRRPELETEAREIAGSILALCVHQVGQRLVLLPGHHGFKRRDYVVVNPSYYVYPALLDFERLVPGPSWRQLVSDGLQICCRDARFGRWQLPADWIELPQDAALPPRLATDRPARFSWDAIRVPLYLVWARRRGEPLLHDIADFWAASSPAPPPAWVDLRSDTFAPYPGHAGVQAVAKLTQVSREEHHGVPRLPRVAEATDYYGAALCLLARLAWFDVAAEASIG